MSAEATLRRPESSVSHSSVVVSASLLLTALLGATQGLLLVFIVGEGSDTDAFLAAYSLYVVFAILGGSLRASIVPVLGAHDSEQSFRQRATELLARVLLLGVVLTAGLAVISIPAGQLLTLGLPSHARWTAVLTLLVLSPAAFLQVYAAAQAAVLVSARRFTVSAGLYVVSGAVALGVSALLLALIGVIGAAIGLLIGGLVLAGGHSYYIARFGIRPRPSRWMLADRGQRDLALVLAAAASISVALQLNLAIALATLSHDPGAITAYSYAFFIVGLALAISSFPLGLVTIPELIHDYARRGIAAAREYLVSVPPYAFAVLVPTLVAFAADGKPLLEAVFAHSLSQHAIDLVYEVGLVLSVMAIPSTFVFLTGSVALALGRSRVFLPLSIATLVIQAAFALPLSSISPVAVAAGHAANLVLTAALLLRLTLGVTWPSIALEALRRSAPAFALSAVFVLVRLPFGSDPGAALAVVSALIGLAAYVALAVVLWPSVARAFLGLLRKPPSPAEAAVGPAPPSA
jgi:peptidoglycan biosynthesis protein MviN/MurJ (putative lipid II flippase)